MPTDIFMHEMHNIVKLRHHRTHATAAKTNQLFAYVKALIDGGRQYTNCRIRARLQMNTQRRSFTPVRKNGKIAKNKIKKKAATSFVMPVCLSVWNSARNLISEYIFENSSLKFRFH